MLEFSGFVLLALFFLLLGFLLLACRRPDPAPWINWPMVIETFAVLLTALLGAGVGLLVWFAAHFGSPWNYVIGIASLVGVVVMFKVVWLVLGINRKLDDSVPSDRPQAETPPAGV